MEKKIVGIAGCGNIGSALAKYIDENLRDKVKKVLLFDADPGKVESTFLKKKGFKRAASVKELIFGSDLVVESACPQAVPEILESCVKSKKDLMVMSVGGLLGREKLIEKVREKGIKLFLPSGAVSGIDAVKASRIAGIESVSLVTRKPVRSVKGAPYLEKNRIDLDSINKETVIFDGNATEAMAGFPQNINVSALLSIAGIGAERTRVRIIVSPEYTMNTHEIEVKSNAGFFRTVTANVPSPDNPKTSYLAALSAMETLRNYFDTVSVGT